MGLAQINIKFSADLRGFSTEMQNSIRRIGVMGKELQTAGRGLSTYLTLPLVAAGAAAVKFASDYQESVNKVEVAFGDASGSVKEFAKTSLESFGIAEGTALDMAATFGDMGTALGLPQKNAAAMSKSLVGLAGDLASFKNISIDIANTALSGIFTGETESLKKLGIVMTEANLSAYALSQGINKQIKDMTQAEKVGLRYNYILSVTKNAQGDFARTGGGAANQMRIFQESMKQVGQQLGAVILPAFTRLITFVNGAIKSFSGLSDGTKTTIVAIAGIAAAIGPLLSVTGSLLTLVPNVITKFNALKDSFTALTTALAANPFTAIAVALTAIVGTLLVANSRFTALTNAQKEFESINTKAAQSIAAETAELNKNLAIAKSDVFLKEQRKAAIDDINAAYPELNKQLTLENVNTAKGIDLTTKLTDALLKKAKVMAAEEKLVDVQKKLLDLQLGNLEAVKPSLWQNFANAAKAGGNAMAFLANSSLTTAENLGTEGTELVKLQQQLISFIGTNKDFQETNDAVNLSLQETIKNQQDQLKSGTIAFYEKQIENLQKLQKEQVTTNAEWLKYEDQITAIQKKIDALTNTKIILPKPELPNADTAFEVPALDNSLAGLKNQLSYFENLREELSKTGQEYKQFDDVISGLQLQIKQIEGADEAITKLDEFDAKTADISEGVRSSFQEAMTSFAEGFAGIIGTFSQGGASLANIGSLVFNTLGNLAIQVGKIAIATGIAVLGIKKALASLNPAVAIAAGVALVALGTIVKSQLKDAGSFTNGGIVGGNSFYGDRIFARVNSGELILNNKQQRALYGQLNAPSGGDGGFVIAETKIVGSDMLLLIKRAEAKEGRTRG